MDDNEYYRQHCSNDYYSILSIHKKNLFQYQSKTIRVKGGKSNNQSKKGKSNKQSKRVKSKSKQLAR